MAFSFDDEANAKLFLGTLEQLKKLNVKLNYQELAEYMGPECTRQHIAQQVFKLRKKSASQQSGEQAASGESAAPSTPAATPKKRRATASKKATVSKMAKKGKQNEEAGEQGGKKTLNEKDAEAQAGEQDNSDGGQNCQEEPDA